MRLGGSSGVIWHFKSKDKLVSFVIAKKKNLVKRRQLKGTGQVRVDSFRKWSEKYFGEHDLRFTHLTNC